MVTTRRRLLYGVVASIFGSVTGCVDLKGDPGSPGDIITINSDNQNHRIMVTINRVNSPKTVDDYSVELRPGERVLTKDVLNKSGNYTVNATLDNSITDTYKDVWLWRNNSSLEGVGIFIRVTEQQDLNVHGFGDKRWPPHKRENRSID